MQLQKIIFLFCFDTTTFPWVFAAFVSLSLAVMSWGHRGFSGTAGSRSLMLLVSGADTFNVAVVLKMVSRQILLLLQAFTSSSLRLFTPKHFPLPWSQSTWIANGCACTPCPELTEINLPWDRITVFLNYPQFRLSKLFLKTTMDRDPLCSLFKRLAKKRLRLPCCDLLRCLV